MNQETIELRWKQAVINYDNLGEKLEIAVQDINWLLEENKQLQETINELSKLVEWLRK